MADADAQLLSDPEMPSMPDMTDEDRKRLKLQEAARSNPLAIPDALYNYRSADSSNPSPAVVQDQRGLRLRRQDVNDPGDPYRMRTDPYSGVKMPQYESVPTLNTAGRLAHAGHPGGLLSIIGASGGNEADIEAASARNAMKQKTFEDQLKLAESQSKAQYARNVYGTQRPVVAADPQSSTGYSYVHPVTGETIGDAPSPVKPTAPAKAPTNIVQAAMAEAGDPNELGFSDRFEEAYGRLKAIDAKNRPPTKGPAPAKAMYIQYEDDAGNNFSNERGTNKWYDSNGNETKPPQGLHRIGTKGPAAAKGPQTPAQVKGGLVAGAVKANHGQPLDDATLQGITQGAAQSARAQGLMPDQRPTSQGGQTTSPGGQQKLKPNWTYRINGKVVTTDAQGQIVQ